MYQSQNHISLWQFLQFFVVNKYMQHQVTSCDMSTPPLCVIGVSGYGDMFTPPLCVIGVSGYGDMSIPPLCVIGVSGYGTEQTDTTLYINASMCTRGYKPINRPIIFQLDNPMYQHAQKMGAGGMDVKPQLDNPMYQHAQKMGAGGTHVEQQGPAWRDLCGGCKMSPHNTLLCTDILLNLLGLCIVCSFGLEMVFVSCASRQWCGIFLFPLIEKFFKKTRLLHA